MSRKENRPSLGGLHTDDDLARIRAYGLSKGFLPTDPAEAAASPPALAAPVSAIPAAPVPIAAPAPLPPRPAPTKPWQAMFPDYLIEELRIAAAREGTAQKVIVMRALQQAGFRVDSLDLQDLRRR